MIHDIYGGYMGQASINGTYFRVSSFSVNPTQEPQFYDHTIGLRDNIPSTIDGAKGDVGFDEEKPQKSIYRPGVIGITGTVSFPVVHTQETLFFEHAKEGSDFSLDYTYDCNVARRFTNCKLNTFSISCAAGDFVQSNVSVMALRVTENSTLRINRTARKFITWDQVHITAPEITGDLSSFEMTINNNCSYIYASGSNQALGLLPAKIRVGMQEVKGSLSFYKKGYNLISLNTQLPKSLYIRIGSLSFTVQVIYIPVKREGGVPAIISTVAFVGVGAYWN